MDVISLEDGGLRFVNVPAAFYEQLSLLSQTCDPDDNPKVVSRLYPHPLDPEEEESMREKAEEDWADFVRPELVSAFDTSLLTVMNDLAQAKVEQSEEDDDEAEDVLPDDVYYRFEIPGDHTEPWFQTLNRARIVLSIKHRLPLDEYPLDEDEQVPLQRILAAHICDSFAEISELLVRQMAKGLS